MKTGIYLVSLLALLASLLLSACAGVDASVLDTAECMGKGNMGIGMAYTMGLKVPDWLEIEAENIFDADSAMPIQYMEIEYGLADDIDAKLRFGLMPDASNAKLLLKKQISKEDKNSTAFVFGGGITKANQHYWERPDGYDLKTDYQLLSGEAQMIFTRELKKDRYLSFAIRGNYHNLYEKAENQEGRNTEFYHAGARVNLKSYHKGFYGILELGAEVPLSVEDVHQVYPWIGTKFSWELKRKK
ncbi:MAG: hypothetical protein M0Q16_07655 [Candidatus Cloacimonetes bacterium]|jgi:hypothetical protein|nr:hypothetical protein [Candidatus Cloacimonadota bacterium]MCK9185232.1 hypothetical protein [Candidatus Cloacimonadota bacterium]MCK9585122.1 hypothetical protein [Candidatus Cloacimonadota bacterium]